MPKVLVLDIDGTLTDSDSTIPYQVIEAIKRLMNKGVTVTLATGRMYTSAKKCASILGIETPLVTYNGAVVQGINSTEPLFSTLIPLDAMYCLFNIAEKYNYYIQVYNDECIFVDKRTKETERDPDLYVARCFEVGRLLEANLKPTPKAMTVAHVLEIPERRAMLEQEIPHNIHYTVSAPGLLEMMCKGVSKAASLDRLITSMGFKASDCVACGDSNNDIEMIQWAGIGYAVANATSPLKSVADEVLSKPRGQGVIELINNIWGD